MACSTSILYCEEPTSNQYHIKTDGYSGNRHFHVRQTDLGQCMSKLVYFCHLLCINRDVKCQLIGAAGGHRAGEDGGHLTPAPLSWRPLLVSASGLLLRPQQSLITDQQLGHQQLYKAPSVPQRVFTITEKDPTSAFSWLKAPTSAFTFKTLC